MKLLIHDPRVYSWGEVRKEIQLLSDRGIERRKNSETELLEFIRKVDNGSVVVV